MTFHACDTATIELYASIMFYFAALELFDLIRFDKVKKSFIQVKFDLVCE